MFVKNKKLLYVFAFIIPVIILIIVYKGVGIYPFGEKTLLFRDLDGQYVSYFASLRNALLGDGNILYSFTKEIGGDMLGLATYYLISPLNLIILLFPLNNITEAIAIITLLKIGLSGLTLSILLSSINKEIKYDVLLFSTAYSLMSFNIVYQSNIMWLDGVYLLPLVILGINKIIKFRKYMLYIGALTAAIITNFYIGFIICIFTTIYFIYYLFIQYKEEEDIKYFILNRIKIFIASSLVSGLLSMVVIIPTLLALNGGKARFEFFTTSIDTNFKFTDIISKLYINGLIKNDIFSSLPNIYCGAFIVVLVLLYFFNYKIRLREKIASATVILILLISFYINKIDLIWHGFNKPVGFPYRYSFVFSFFIILLAYKSYKKIKDLRKRYIGIILILIMGASFSMLNNDLGYLSNKQIIITTIFAVFYLIVILISKSKLRFKGIVLIILGVSVFAELGANAYSILNRINFTKRDQFLSYLTETSKVVDYVKEQDNSFYRLEKTFSYSRNDAMLLNYNGLTHFSSMFKKEVKDTLAKLGLDGCAFWYKYDVGSTPITDSILGVKYILTKDLNIKQYNEFYKKVAKVDGISIYENLRTFPIAGMMVDDDILELDISNNDNTFDIQTEIINSMIGSKSEKYFNEPKNITERNVNLTAEKIDGGTLYKKKDTSKDGYIELSFKNLSDKYLYMHVPNSGETKSATVTLNGKSINWYSYYNYKMMTLGKFKIGAPINIKIIIKQPEFFIKDKYLAYYNSENFDKVYKELEKNQFNMRKISDTNIVGNVISQGNNEVLYTTIPYSKDWNVYIDGKEAKVEKIVDSFIGVEIPNGEHHIEFLYKPRGLFVGLGISLATLVGLISFKIITNKKNKKI